MMKPKMSSRERMLAAIRRQEVDYVPLSTHFSESQSAEWKLRAWRQGNAYGEHSLRHQVEDLGIDPVVYLHVSPSQHMAFLGKMVGPILFPGSETAIILTILVIATLVLIYTFSGAAVFDPSADRSQGRPTIPP